MPSKRLGINRDQWKQALLKVIGSQTETLLNKGDIITNAAALVGYTPSPANAMARAALLELENERKVERVRGGHDSAKRYRLVREWRAEQEDAPSSLDAPTSGAVLAEEFRDGVAPGSGVEPELARMCEELFAFFEETGEGLVEMARTGKALIARLKCAVAGAAAQAPHPEQRVSLESLESKVDFLADQIAALTELFGVQRREFEDRRAGILSMLEEEARQRKREACL